MEGKKISQQLLRYQIHFSNVDVKQLENDIYKTKDDLKKLHIEFRRVSKVINTDPEFFEKYSYKLYEIYSLFKSKGNRLTDAEIYDFKCKIVGLELLCDVKIGLVSVFADEQICENITFKDYEEKYETSKKTS